MRHIRTHIDCRSVTALLARFDTCVKFCGAVAKPTAANVTAASHQMYSPTQVQLPAFQATSPLTPPHRLCKSQRHHSSSQCTPACNPTSLQLPAIQPASLTVLLPAFQPVSPPHRVCKTLKITTWREEPTSEGRWNRFGIVRDQRRSKQQDHRASLHTLILQSKPAVAQCVSSAKKRQRKCRTFPKRSKMSFVVKGGRVLLKEG